jgi:hypothetical protein
MLSDESHRKDSVKDYAWEDCGDTSKCLKCDRKSAHIMAGGCAVGRSNKLFYKHATNLRDLVRKLETEPLPELEKMVETLYDLFVRKSVPFQNHNLDINTLHFKPCS